MRRFVLAMFAGLLAPVLLAAQAAALDTLKVGKASAISFTFIPLEVGQKVGIWDKNGIALEIFSLAGGAQMQQALMAGSIEVGLGSGTSLAAVAKGADFKGIAAFAGPPDSMMLVVAPSAPIHAAGDLKGRLIGITLAGSMEDFLVRQLSRLQGWDAQTGIPSASLGAVRTRIAALKNGQIDGLIVSAEEAYELQHEGIGRIVLNFGHLIPNFITHAFFARNQVIAERPAVLRRFLTGWWQTIDYMRAHKPETVAVAREIFELAEDNLARAYDEIMPMMLVDGNFDPSALAVLSRSFVELGMLEKEPDMAALYTTMFLPIQH